MTKEFKLRTVAGRPVIVEAESGCTVEGVLEKACADLGYAHRGSRLVVRGKNLDVSAVFEEAVEEGQVPTFIALKQSYSAAAASASERASSEQTHTTSRDRPTDLDLSLPEYDGPLTLTHRQGLAQLQNALVRTPASEMLDLLYIHPTMLHIRSLVQTDPTQLAACLAQAKVLSPKLIEFAGEKNELFLHLLNEPLARRGSGSSSNEDDDLQAMYQQIGPDDVESLNRIQSLGPFPRDLVLQAYLDAGRNEHLAAQYLMDLASYEPMSMLQPADPSVDEFDLLQAQVQQAEASGGEAPLLDALLALGAAHLRAGNKECEAPLLRALEGSLRLHTASPVEAEEFHSRAVQALGSFYDSVDSKFNDQLLLHESQALMALAKKGVRPESLLGSEGLTVSRLLSAAKKEGVDLVFIYLEQDELCVWQVRHAEAEGQAPVVLRRRDSLGAGDTTFLATAPQDLAAALSAASPQRAWGLLHRLYTVVFGEGGCADWFPTKACVCSSLPLPFHALAPHGGVPLSRARQINQAPSVLWLQAAQALAVTPVPTVPGRKRLLRSTYFGNAPGYVTSKKVAPSRLSEGEWVGVAHFGPNTSGGDAVVRAPSAADTAVYAPGVDVDPHVASYSTEAGALWACSAVVPVLPAVAPAAGGPLARPVRDTQLVLQSFYAALGRGEHKAEAYAASLTVGPEAHIRSWVPWVFMGTRLLLGGRRAHVMSEKLKATDDYRYLETHAMHIVFDKMIGHLLDAKPTDPVDSLLAFMEQQKATLEDLGPAGVKE